MSCTNSETLCFLWDVSNSSSHALNILKSWILDLFNLTCLFRSSLVHFFEFGSWLFNRKKAPSGGGHAQSPAHRWPSDPRDRKNIRFGVWNDTVSDHDKLILAKVFRTKSLVKFNTKQITYKVDKFNKPFPSCHTTPWSKRTTFCTTELQKVP